MHFAVIGAGMAGIACARTLQQAGCRVTVFEQGREAGGRMATRETEFGTFDTGAQYFTVRDERFALALKTAPALHRPWSANAVRVLDPLGRVVAAALPAHEPHWVGVPGMSALVQHWAEPLDLELQTRVLLIARDAVDPGRWQLHTESIDGARRVHAGFDAVLLAIPAQPALALLGTSKLVENMVQRIAAVETAPCWTLIGAWPLAMQPGQHGNHLHIGPQWNAARSTHHRLAWVARESSKPQRGAVERWTAQAGPEWSIEHQDDESDRVRAKLLKAFGEITGIVAPPSYASVLLWPHARTIRPLSADGDTSHLWHGHARIGVCGDWCIGHRVEDAFISGLELALAALDSLSPYSR